MKYVWVTKSENNSCGWLIHKNQVVKKKLQKYKMSLQIIQKVDLNATENGGVFTISTVAVSYTHLDVYKRQV